VFAVVSFSFSPLMMLLLLLLLIDEDDKDDDEEYGAYRSTDSLLLFVFTWLNRQSILPTYDDEQVVLENNV
jgi:hypothetical protein